MSKITKEKKYFQNVTSLESKHSYLDIFNTKPSNKKPRSSSVAPKSKNPEGKIQLPIVETLLIDNGQVAVWLFTDISGYVLKRSAKKMNKEYIISYFINSVLAFLNNHLGIVIKKNEIDILGDINRLSAVADQNIQRNSIFKNEFKYLEHFNSMKFFYFKTQLKEYFGNMFELNRVLNDNNKLSGCYYIQSFLGVNLNVKPIMCKYSKKDNLAPKKIQIFIQKPNYKLKNNKLNNNPAYESEDDENNVENNNRNEMILLNDANLASYLFTLCEPYIKLIEKTKSVNICEISLNFVKDNDGKYYLTSCEKVLCIHVSLENDIGIKMRIIKDKTIPKDIQCKIYEKISKNVFCFGEFCEYNIPKFFKNLKKNNKVDEINQFVIPKENKFSDRDRNYNLPNSLPVFMIKKAYDNANLVNIVLKAYSIFPKNFDKDTAFQQLLKERIQEEDRKRREEEQKKTAREKKRREFGTNVIKLPSVEFNTGALSSNHSRFNTGINNAKIILPTDTSSSYINTTEENKRKKVEENKNVITLYRPTPDKFNHINHDIMYSKKAVCNNCYVIYTLIQNFLSNIDETTSSFKSLSKAKNLLIQGDNLKNPYQKGDSFDKTEKKDNLFLEEGRTDFSLKKILKKNLKKLENNGKKEATKFVHKKINKAVDTKKDEFKKTFSYNLNVNPKILKFNLVAEKTKNKFFNLIFNEMRSEPESIYQKLGIKKMEKNFTNTMTNLRMHMGINASSYTGNLRGGVNLNSLKIINDEETNNQNMAVTMKSFRRSAQNTQTDHNHIDTDIFLTFKNMKKKFSSPFTSPVKKSETVQNNLFFFNKKKFISPFEDLESDSDNKSVNSHNSFSNSKDSNANNTYTDSDQNNSNSDSRHSISNSDLTNIQESNLHEEYYHTHEDNNINYIRKNSKSQKKCITSKFLVKTSNYKDYKDEDEQFDNSVSYKRQANSDNERKATKLNINTIVPYDASINLHDVRNNNHHNTQEMSKKITVSSMFYYDWSKDLKQSDAPYYYGTTPLTKFNEMNIPVQDNPLLLTKTMTFSDFINIGKFENVISLNSFKVFVYDQYTAVPYKVIDLKSSTLKYNVPMKLNLDNVINLSPKAKKPTVRRSSTAQILKEGKKPRLLVIVLNDFFDSFTKYQETMTSVWSSYSGYLEKLKLVFFNFPGQSTTIFPKKGVFNNIYYIEFLDRFLYHLSENNIYDHSYHVIFVGIGNGGHVAMSYTSAYEKYWDFLHSIILFNSYCDNDDFLNKSMLEILKIVDNSKNPKLIDFFLKSITVNPYKLIDYNNKEEESNPITMNGYHNIARGYFFNIKINHKEISTPIVMVHSNQNCFITINNVNNILNHTKNKTYNVTPAYDNNLYKTYDFEEFDKSNKIKRKLIVIDGSHDLSIEDNSHISNVITSYMKYLIKVNSFNK